MASLGTIPEQRPRGIVWHRARENNTLTTANVPTVVWKASETFYAVADTEKCKKKGKHSTGSGAFHLHG